MMKVLIVEDEDASLDETIAVIKAEDPSAEVTAAGDRDTAFKRLAELDFDLVICDLKIPPAPNDLDASEDHGLAVHARVQEVCPGTPLIFLTGKATPTNVQRQLAYGAVAEYYGMASAPLVQLAVKDSSRSEIQYIRDMVQGLQSLQNCEVVVHGPREANELLSRAIQVYGRRLQAHNVEITLFSGLSGADVARASFALDNGQTRAVLVKLQDREDALDEVTRYDLNVPNKLRVGYYAPSIRPSAEYGLRKKVALFYGLALNTVSLFELASRDPSAAAGIIESIQTDHEPWTSEHHVQKTNVGELRRKRLPDDDSRAAPLLEVDWRHAIEAVDVDLRLCTTHGDLHGLNLLIDPSSRATLIDFGDVGPGSAALDPVTLEMSFLFHAERPYDPGAPSIEQLRYWHDLDVYTAGSRYEAVLRACREWAYRIAPPQTVLATAYAHAARQVKYPDVANERALAVAASAGAALLNTL